MPKLIECQGPTGKTSIDEAIKERDSAKGARRSAPVFYCRACNTQVYAHVAGKKQRAHFEHKERQNCEFSDPPRGK
jgi:competence CoiA-like predicted nuclease